jgi:hypothetical protein
MTRNGVWIAICDVIEFSRSAAELFLSTKLLLAHRNGKFLAGQTKNGATEGHLTWLNNEGTFKTGKLKCHFFFHWSAWASCWLVENEFALFHRNIDRILCQRAHPCYCSVSRVESFTGEKLFCWKICFLCC